VTEELQVIEMAADLFVDGGQAPSATAPGRPVSSNTSDRCRAWPQNSWPGGFGVP